jgi:hypothetical protein
MVSLYLALGHRMIRGTPNMFDSVSLEIILESLGTKAGHL